MPVILALIYFVIIFIILKKVLDHFGITWIISRKFKVIDKKRMFANVTMIENALQAFLPSYKAWCSGEPHKKPHSFTVEQLQNLLKDDDFQKLLRKSPKLTGIMEELFDLIRRFADDDLTDEEKTDEMLKKTSEWTDTVLKFCDKVKEDYKIYMYK